MNLEEKFSNYLSQNKNLSQLTVKNYLSDYRHFWEWLEKIEPTSDGKKINRKIQKIDLPLLKRYKAYLSSSTLAKSTVKRRLATIRIFCQFLLDQDLLKADPSFGLENPSDTDPKEKKISQLTTNFERYLKNQGASQNTIKNYLADARNYLEWAVTNN